jgi:transcriptional regulator with XRE-family HTH domain
MAVLILWRKRRDEGMTQTQLAERLGCNKGWLSKKLSGPANWTLKTLGHMVEALDGELEIVVRDLREPVDQPRNFDAYEDDEQSPPDDQMGLAEIEEDEAPQMGALAQ